MNEADVGLNAQIFVNLGFSLFGILLGILLTVIFKRIGDLSMEVRKLEERHNVLSVDVPKNYVAKIDFQHMIDTLFAKLDRIEAKLDSKVDKNK